VVRDTGFPRCLRRVKIRINNKGSSESIPTPTLRFHLSAIAPTIAGNIIPPAFPAALRSENIVAPPPGKISELLASTVGQNIETKNPRRKKEIMTGTPL